MANRRHQVSQCAEDSSAVTSLPPKDREGDFYCQKREVSVPRAQCRKDYMEAEAFGRKHSECFHCPQGKQNRQDFSGLPGISEEEDEGRCSEPPQPKKRTRQNPKKGNGAPAPVEKRAPVREKKPVKKHKPVASKEVMPNRYCPDPQIQGTFACMEKFMHATTSMAGSCLKCSLGSKTLKKALASKRR